MAINFPNDPATTPGDGGTWVDGDGNTWTVEIVSGEAIWTMTEAADTGGGGGGDVTSVAGKTGAVDLELNDLTDATVSILSDTRLFKFENSGDEGTVVFNPNGTSTYEYAGLRIRGDGAAQLVGGIGSEAGERSCVLSKAAQIQFASAPLSNSDDDNYTVKIEVTNTDGDAMYYRAAPTLGADATDLVIPTMGQVRAAIASNGGTSVSLNDLTDVNYTQKDSDDSWTLEPINLDEILFNGQDTPSDVTRKVYTNTIYGMALASYQGTSGGSYVYAHETKGVVLRSPGDNGVLWIEGDISTTTSQPEIRISNGDGASETPTGNYIGFKMPAGVTSDFTWTLPAVDGAASSVLTSDGAGNLTFEPLPEVVIPTTTYEIGYESTTAYKFTGPGLDGTELNPTLYVVRGQKYIFSNVLGAHPFQLQTVAGTGESPYTDGVTGDQPIDLTSFEWEVQMDTPSTIFYQCTAHAPMAGSIKVLDNSGAGGAGAVDSVNSQTGVVSLGIQDMNDFGLNDAPAGGSVVILRIGVNYTLGYIFEYLSSEVYISTVDKDGTVLSGLPSPADPANGTFTYTIDGLAYQVTYTRIADAFNGFYRFAYDSDNSDVSGLQDLNNEDKDVAIKFGDAPPSIPLAEGDILQWNDNTQEFQPAALATIATSGDYNDLINAPSAGDAPVTSVNTETGDVSLGIQDMDDYAPNSGLSYRYAGPRQPNASGTPTNPGEWGASSFRWNNEDSDGNTWTTAGAVGELWVSEDGVTWQNLGSQTISTFSNIHFIDNSESLTPNFDGWTTLYLALSNPVLPLAEGDILHWNNTDQKFKPAQLDYSQINNTPAAPARITPSVTTAALAVDATETGEITGTGATGFLISCQTDVAAWVRLYCTPDAMTADASRDIDTDPAPGSGVLFEALYSTFTEKPITPGTTYFNLSGLDKLYYRITNKSAIADTPITVTFKLLPME